MRLKSMEPLRYISIFSGIEAASVAWTPLGWIPVAFAEVDPFCSALLALRFPSVPNLGDVTKADWAAYRGLADVVVGGFPCQSFSIAGKRASLTDPRGNLSLAYVEVVHAVDPSWSLAENVPGWLSTEDNAFGVFLGALVGHDAPLVSILEGGRWPDAGVADGPKRTAAWRILDAQWYGLSQRRRRVFVLSARGTGNRAAAEALFPVASGVRRHIAPSRTAGQGAARSLAPGIGGGSGHQYRQKGNEDQLVANTLGGVGQSGGFRTTDLDNQGAFITVPDIAGSLNARESKGPLPEASLGTVVVVPIVAAPLSAVEQRKYDDDSAGRAHNLIVVATPILEAGKRDGAPIVFDARQNNIGVHGDMPSALDQNGYSQGIAYMPTRTFGKDGEVDTILAEREVCDSLHTASGQGNKAPLVAFDFKQDGDDAAEIAPTMRATNHDKSHANEGSHLAVASVECAVRRLTPREAERLMGVPDGWTLFPWGKARRRIEVDFAAYLRQQNPEATDDYVASLCADGNRYRALGNSIAVTVIRWLGQRIMAVRERDGY
jgi:DNA (cytosine-5)-methyltransferase 1